jgi:nucleoside-diphosphate-sugar epimerase
MVRRSTQAPSEVLVTGAAGKLGRAILDALAAEGRRTRAASRSPILALPRGATEVRIGEISSATDWSAALAGAGAVVHCAALTRSDEPAEFRRVNTEGTIALARQAAAAGVRRFVFISSLTVNGRSSKGRPFRPDDPPDPQTPYSFSKLEAERGLRALAETGLEVAIIRPPRIVWPETGGNLALLARLVRKGMPLPFGLIDHNRRDNVSPESIISLVRLCLDHPAAAGETFLVADDAPLSTRELLLRIGRQVGRRPKLLPVPRALLRLTVSVLPARMLGGMSRNEMWDELCGSLELDLSRTRDLLGWRPTPSGLASAVP